ncbi:MAG: hypothetical protein KGQ83_08635, partial [Planctomycetes bacterium]|nr:hypothetical protein [Planctomycetota bacterium]
MSDKQKEKSQSIFGNDIRPSDQFAAALGKRPIQTIPGPRVIHQPGERDTTLQPRDKNLFFASTFYFYLKSIRNSTNRLFTIACGTLQF